MITEKTVRLLPAGAYEGRSIQLRGTAFDDCDTSLLWTYSQVGHKCCFHSQRITPRAVRKRTYVYIRRRRVAIVNRAAMEQEREGEIERLRKRQATTPHRTAKTSRLLEAKLRSKTVSRPPQMTAQLGGPFPTSDATWEPQACVQYWRFRSDNPLECSGW